MSRSRPWSAGPAGQRFITNLSQNKTSPKWTFGGRRPNTGRTNTPGPGSYVPGTVRSRTPSYGFGTSSREIGRPTTAPGPGAYVQERANSVGPNWGFGSSKRGEPGSHVGTPGPGYYQPNFSATRTEPPRYTATPRRRLNLSAEVPGPGQYDPLSSPKRAPSPHWGFGTAPRQNEGHSTSPGPGAYQSCSGFGEGGPKYSMRPRADFGSRGPGANSGWVGEMYTQFGY